MTHHPIDSAAYYDQHTAQYVKNTQHVDMSPLHERFLDHLPAKARILDAGCGSGRDSVAFKRLGHEVIAYDASAAMARHASQALGQEVPHLRHENIDFVEAFDGIWSNASLLHVPQIDLSSVFGTMQRALVPGGILFTSFKLGEGEERRGERHFSNHNDASFRALIDQVPGLELIETWISNDLRPGREHEQWLNALCMRQPR